MRTTPYTGPSCRCPAFDRMHEFPCCLNRPKVAAPPPEPAPVSPMVERVARALYERDPVHGMSWDECCTTSPELADMHRSEAQTAIEAYEAARDGANE